MTILFKLLLMFLLLRVGWGALNWIRALSSRAGHRFGTRPPGYDSTGEEIEDADFEEIPEERGNGS
jgi:hypothetical protein